MRPIIAVILLAPLIASASDSRSIPVRDRAVDMVAVKNGPVLFGAIVKRADGALTIAVNRQWLKSADADAYKPQADAEVKRAASGLTALVDRLKKWRAERAGEKQLDFFLDREQQAAAARLAAFKKSPPAPQQFFLIEIPAADVARGYLQAPARRRIAMIAWKRGLKNVETRKSLDLFNELKDAGVDPQQQVDLSDRVPVIAGDDEQRWAARKAIVEYQFRKPLDFQGTGSTIFRTDSGAKRPDPTQLLTAMLGSQLQSTLNELLEEPSVRRWRKKKGPSLEKAIAEAKQEGAIGFRVTTFDSDLLSGRVTVQTRFVARMPNGQWETVWRSDLQGSTATPRPDLEKRIAADPQVKAAVEMVQKLGLSVGEDRVKQAMRFGAVVMESLETANSRFYAFRDRYLKRLDGPPLP